MGWYVSREQFVFGVVLLVIAAVLYEDFWVSQPPRTGSIPNYAGVQGRGCPSACNNGRRLDNSVCPHMSKEVSTIKRIPIRPVLRTCECNISAACIHRTRIRAHKTNTGHRSCFGFAGWQFRGVGVGRGLECSVFFPVCQRMEYHSVRSGALPRYSRPQHSQYEGLPRPRPLLTTPSLLLILSQY